MKHRKPIAICSCHQHCYSIEQFSQHDDNIQRFGTQAVHRWVYVEDLIISEKPAGKRK